MLDCFEPGSGTSEGLEFAEEIFGGAVPHSLPAVEKGLRRRSKRCPRRLPVVNLKAALVDGSYHAVDSNSRLSSPHGGVAADAAGRSVLLEPIDKLMVHIPTIFSAISWVTE